MRSYFVALVLLLFIVGCKTTETSTDSQNVTKKLIKEENVSAPRNITKRPEVPEKTCQQQVNELQNELDKRRLNLLSADSNVTKASLLLSYLKNAYGRENDYERQKEVLDAVAEQRRKLQTQVKDAKAALKILASKCGIKVRFDID